MHISPGVRRSAYVALICLAVVAAFLLLRRDAEPAPFAASPPPSPTPATPEPEPQPQPFEVELRRVKGLSASNERLFGRRTKPAPRVTDRAARQAVASLQRYLDTTFVDPQTRYTNSSLKDLLTRRARKALSKKDREALGIGLPEIAGGRTGRATARAFVLRNRREVDAVTVVYRMRMRLQPPGDGPVRILRQEGSMLFVPNAHGEWKADLIDVRLRTEGAGA